MSQLDPLIRTKLRPPFTRTSLISRPRLTGRITEGLRGPLTLLVAPAGFGKTTLAASASAGCGMPVAWLSLDKHDDPAARFLRYLAAALHEADPAIGEEARCLLAAAPETPAPVILTSLVNDLDAAGEEAVLVLDDFHCLRNQGVHDAVAFLLDHSPSNLHLLIATRSDPPLPLARLRARGQATELRAADLSFTVTETARFLNETMGLDLDAAATAQLAERTEGWITGLQMAAISLQNRSDRQAFVAAFSGTNRHVLDYLLEEVLAHETQTVRNFLRQTAFLTRLCGPLCDAVTGASDGQTMLEELERRGLFLVALDDERRWYRYHHLFADLLRARLQQEAPDDAAQRRSQAAAWCEQNGQTVEAIDYALGGQDFTQAARLIEDHWGQAISEGAVETVWSWLNALPEESVRASAPLCVAYGWALWLQGRMDEIEAHLAAAEDAQERRPESIASAEDRAVLDRLSIEIAALRAFVARYRGRYQDAIALAEQALSQMPGEQPAAIGAQLRALAYLALASAFEGAGHLEQAVEAYAATIRWSRSAGSAAGVAGITYRLVGLLRLLGRLREADAACRDALKTLQTQGLVRLPAAGILHVAMGEVLAERNELEAAAAHLARGLELGKWSGRLSAVQNAAPVRSRLCLAQGDGQGALTAIRQAEAALDKLPSALAKAELLACKAGVLVRLESLNEAARCAEEAVCLAGQDHGLTGETASLAASRALCACAEPDRAVAQLTQSIDAAETSGRWGAVIELRVLRSLTQVRQGAMQAATADLDHALALAEPEGYARVFVDEGRPMQALLTRWLTAAEPGPPQAFGRRLLADLALETGAESAGRDGSSSTGGLLEPLSRRELDVLRIMAQGSTNREIARQLIIAPGTVKAHTASIYRKLDVANRTEAVARAREFGILL